MRREGRLTTGQARALDELYPRFGIPEAETPIDLPALFGREAEVLVEIGTGNGEALLEMATAHPERDHLGIEVHRPGIGRLLLGIEERGLGNVRVLCQDAVVVLRERIAPATLSAVCLYFPDPWPKKRHHKRRIVQPAFVELVRQRLVPGGEFRMATDWAPYAEHMVEVMAAAEGWEALGDDGSRPRTHFEQRGERLGHAVTDLGYRRV